MIQRCVDKPAAADSLLCICSPLDTPKGLGRGTFFSGLDWARNVRYFQISNSVSRTGSALRLSQAADPAATHKVATVVFGVLA
jgi:hypothetical protein